MMPHARAILFEIVDTRMPRGWHRLYVIYLISCSVAAVTEFGPFPLGYFDPKCLMPGWRELTVIFVGIR